MDKHKVRNNQNSINKINIKKNTSTNFFLKSTPGGSGGFSLKNAVQTIPFLPLHSKNISLFSTTQVKDSNIFFDKSFLYSIFHSSGETVT